MLKELKDKLYSKIPMTKYMQMDIDSIKDNNLITIAPLAPNINDKNTGFAGSLSTLVTISAWSVCYLKVKELGYLDAMIAVIKSDTAYRAPVTKDIICYTEMPNEKQIELLKNKLKNKKSASIKINSKIIQDGNICVEYSGFYIIKI